MINFLSSDASDFNVADNFLDDSASCDVIQDIEILSSKKKKKKKNNHGNWLPHLFLVLQY
jgi:hypothetical protein